MGNVQVPFADAIAERKLVIAMAARQSQFCREKQALRSNGSIHARHNASLSLFEPQCA